MKESRYNISMEYKGQQLLFNSRTIATAALDEAALEILDAIRKGEQVENSNLALEMKRVGFLVEDVYKRQDGALFSFLRRRSLSFWFFSSGGKYDMISIEKGRLL